MARRCGSASYFFGCRTTNRGFTFRVLLRFLVFNSLPVLWTCAAVGRVGINVALHAQVPPSSEMVVGSAVTMAGVRQALLRRPGGSSGEVSGEKDGKKNDEGRSIDIKIAHAQVFYPFEYGGLHERHWDLVVIEGWFKMINVFIHEVRAVGYPRPTVVLFYCLDPRFPGLAHVSALDVDGFLTNSESTQQFLLPSAPTALIPLAVDTEAFPFYPDPPPPAGSASDDTADGGSGGGRVVYVGAAGALEYKEMLAWMLREAAPYGLDIYGSGWQDVPELSGHWRGVLPEGDLAAVYGRALAVIGVTMDAQRESGMINNRVFEAMSVGAPLISEHFPALEDLFGDSLLYVRRPGDVTRHIEHLLPQHSYGLHAGRDEKFETRARQQRRAMIEGGHTWAQRVEDMLSFASSLPGNGLLGLAQGEEKGGHHEARCSRRRQGGCLTLAVVVDPDLEEDVTFGSTLVPAVGLLGSVYRVTWLLAPQENQEQAGEEGGRQQRKESGLGEEGEKTHEWRRMHLPLDTECLLGGYDIVWAAGRWGGPADSVVRELLSLEEGSGSRSTMPRLATQARGMVLWGELCTPDTAARNDGRGRRRNGIEEEGCPSYAGDAGLRWYDVVYCQTVWDHEFLVKEAFDGSVSDNLQQAWGFGSRTFPADDPDIGGGGGGGGGGETKSASKTFVSHDLLVIGTDDQFLDMLQLVQSAGLASVALAAVVSPGDAAARSGLALITPPAADVDAEEDTTPAGGGGGVTDLPMTFSLHVAAGSSEGSLFGPLSAEVMLVRSAADADALARLSSGAAKVVIAATGQVGLWVTLLTATAAAAAAAAAHERHPQGREQHHARVVDDDNVIITTGDGRVQSLADQWPQGWDSHFYSRRLVAGMTRAFCLGRGTSRISFVHPPVGGGSVMVVGLNGKVTVEVLVEDFDVGREGQWCVTAGGRTLLCMLRNEFVVDVHMLSPSSVSGRDWQESAPASSAGSRSRPFSGKGGGGNETQAIASGNRLLRIEMVVELRSNVYRDVLYRSEPVPVLVDPERGRTDGTVWCTYEKGVVSDCNRSTGSGSDSGSNHAEDHDGSSRGAYRASIDVEEFLQAGAIAVVDV